MSRTTIDELLSETRRGLVRVGPADAQTAVHDGASLIDIRSESQQMRDGLVPGALVIGRNALEWRLDPDCAHRHPEAPGIDAQERCGDCALIARESRHQPGATIDL